MFRRGSVYSEQFHGGTSKVTSVVQKRYGYGEMEGNPNQKGVQHKCTVLYAVELRGHAPSNCAIVNRGILVHPPAPPYRQPQHGARKKKAKGVCAWYGLRAPRQRVRIEFEEGCGTSGRLLRACFPYPAVWPKKQGYTSV